MKTYKSLDIWNEFQAKLKNDTLTVSDFTVEMCQYFVLTKGEYYDIVVLVTDRRTESVQPKMRDYLSVKQQAIPQQKKIYTDFKDFVEFGKIETEPLLAEMLVYAKRYQILLDGNTGSSALDACIARLNRLETTVTRPYFLEVLRLRDENEPDADEPGSRHELRRKYWTFALPVIRKAHGEGGAFSNVNPSRDNWINGFFGIGGFYLLVRRRQPQRRITRCFMKVLRVIQE